MIILNCEVIINSEIISNKLVLEFVSCVFLCDYFCVITYVFFWREF